MRLKHFNDFLTDFLQLHSWLLHIRISCHWHEYHTLWVRFLSMTFPYKNLSLAGDEFYEISSLYICSSTLNTNFFHLMWILCSNRLILTPCSIYYYNIIFGFLSLVGEGFVGGRVYTSPFRNFLISDFVLQDTKKILCQRYQNCLRHLWLKFFIFHMSRGWFPWPLPPINPEVFFSDILARQVG